MHALIPFSAELAYIAQYGYAAFALLMFAGEIFGFIPLGILLVAMGALAHEHIFSLPLLVIVAIVASVSGNFVLYSIAGKLGRHEFYLLRVKDTRLMTRIESHMHRRPWLMIFSTRFVGIASYPTTLLAGIAQIPRHVFLPAVVLGNGICCIMYLLVGYVLGGAWAHDAKITSLVIGGIGIVGSLTYLIFKLMRCRAARARRS